MTTLGAVFVPQLPPERLHDVVRAADEAGLEELWLWEDCFREGGLSTAVAALAWSQRLRVGVGLLPVPLRNVALAAMELSTIFRLFPGRAVVAVGHGVQDWMGQVGARPGSPLTLLREHAVALRALLRGERVSVQGRYVRLDDVALDWPPPGPVPVLLGATGPRTLRLSGEISDGTLLTAGTDPAGVLRARRLIDEGRSAAGRTDPHPVVAFLHAATGPSARERMAAERVRWGYTAPGAAGADPADPDPADPDVTVTGDAHEVADAVHRWAAAGADTVVLQPTPDDPDPEGFMRFVAEQVRPLVG